MANIEHADILSANTHEPKHVTLSSISDAGKVITPSSTVAGTSELRSLTFDELDRSAVPHMNLDIIANATTISATIASDTTLHTSADYTDVTLFSEDLTNPSVSLTFNAGTGEITINETGIYRGDLWMSVSSDTASTLVGVRYGIGGNYFPAGSGAVVKGLSKVAGDISDLAGFGEVPLASGQVLTIGVAVDKTSLITIHEAAFTLRRVA